MKSCVKCGCTEFYSNRKCKQCAKEMAKKWKKENPQKVKLISSVYYQLNKDNLNGKSKIRYCVNKEEIRLKQKLYVERNYEKVRATQKKCQQPHLIKEASVRYRKKFPDRCRESTAKWEAKNPDAARIRCINRRARKLKNGGILSAGLFDRLFKLQQGKCACCREYLSYVKPKSPMDHITPLAKGGINTDKNIQLLCQPCNSSKHAKDPIDFMQSRGFLL